MNDYYLFNLCIALILGFVLFEPVLFVVTVLYGKYRARRQREFTAPTARGAKGALVAHGKHCQSRTQMDVDVIRAAQAVISEVRDGE